MHPLTDRGPPGVCRRGVTRWWPGCARPAEPAHPTTCRAAWPGRHGGRRPMSAACSSRRTGGPRRCAGHAGPHQEAVVRKVTVGLLGLTLATGLGAGLTAPAVAAPRTGSSPVGGAKIDRGAVSDELPNPAEAKRRQLRQEALTRLLDGKGTVQQR